MPTLCLTQDPLADQLLQDDPFALLLGMLLISRYRWRWPLPPRKIADRLGGLDPAEIAACEPERFAALCAETPAVHRFPGSMSADPGPAREVVDRYGGNAAGLWTQGDPDGAECCGARRRCRGFGEQKAKIFLALLGKQYGVTPPGWRTAARDYGKAGTHMSIADVVDKGSLEQVRAYKKKMKAAAKEAK